MKNEFKHSVENLRGISICFVMLSHMESFSVLGDAEKYFMFIIKDATTWFIFISGYLFAYTESSKQFDFKSYIAKKIRFVISPYLILSIPAIFSGFYFKRPELTNLNSLEYILWSLTVGGNIIGPMWFIPMIVIFFLFSPLFIKLNRSPILKEITYTLLAFSIFSSRPFMNANPFLAFIHFLGFYLLGLYLFRLRYEIDNLSKKQSIAISATSLVVFFTILFLYAKESSPYGSYTPFSSNIGVFNPIQFGKLSLLIAIFIFLEKFGQSYNKYLSHLANISFGLFFIHGFYIAIFVKIILPITPNNITRLATEFFVIAVASIITIGLIKKLLNKKSRYIIGC